MRVEHSIVIARPVPAVFALVGNPDRDTDWGSLIVESRQSSPGPIGAGTTFEQTATFLGGRLSISIEIVEFDPGRRVCYRATKPAAVEHCRTFEEIPEGTRLTFVTNVDSGRLALPAGLLRRIAERQMEADMDGIKTCMEESAQFGG